MVFDGLKESDLVRNQFERLSSEVFKWECLTPTAFLKEEYKPKAADKEVVQAYLKAAESLYVAFDVDNNPTQGIMKLFKSNQMCMPFLFLCRHSLELAIKLFYKNKTGDQLVGHELQKLWDKASGYLPEDDTTKGMGVFIAVINSLDNDGTMLRYSTNRSGEAHENTPTFVKADKIQICTSQLVEYLISQTATKEVPPNAI